jgi:PAS domain S-box-containing protein
MSDPASALVLIINDSEAGRYASARFLRRAGLRVIEAATGTAGLEHVRTEHPDIVLLDVGLPDINGLEVCRRIKDDPASASALVIQVSASFVRPSDAVRGLEAGADAYLTEPLEPTVLVATVNALLRMRRAEDRARVAGGALAATFAAISEGVCLLDADGVVRNCNAALATFAGRPAAEIVGYRWTDLVGSWLGEDVAALPERAAQDRAHIDVAVSGRWLQVAVDPVGRSPSARTGAVCTVSDITERKRVEELNAAILARERLGRSEAEAANRSKDEFLAILSHELRTPLTAILGWVRTLRFRQTDAGALAHGLEVIERNTRMQAQLIEDLLDVSRIITGKLSLDRRPVVVAAVIDTALESIRGAAEAHGVSLAFDVEEPGLRVDGDAARLQQVFANLLSNGVKFTPPGGRVEVRVSEREGNVVVMVRDTGRGIPAEFLPYVFDRFRQADGGITRQKGGLGLGLAIVRHLVELHGGTVSVDSAGEDRGATFCVTLPALRDVAPAPTWPRAGGTGPVPRLDGLWVLVVEDDADTREVVAMVLSAAGAAVKTVSSLAAAEEAVAAATWDVLVSDLGMPDGDGYDLIRRLRARPSLASLPAVALSAHAMADDTRLSLRAGFDVHLPKPVDPDDLVRVVASLVRRRVDRAG